MVWSEAFMSLCNTGSGCAQTQRAFSYFLLGIKPASASLMTRRSVGSFIYITCIRGSAARARIKDSDGDGILDTMMLPNDAGETDGDGVGNNADKDDDGDGVTDDYDYRPLEAAVWENPNEILSADALANAPVGIIPEVEVSSDRDAMRLLIQATYGPRPEDFRTFNKLAPPQGCGAAIPYSNLFAKTTATA